MRVAVAQFAAGRDKAANRERVGALIGEAASRGAALVVLPEAAMYPFGRPDEPLTGVAEPLDGPFAESLALAAKAGDTTVLAGMFETAADGRVFNTLLAVGPDGVRGHYRKLHLFDALGWRESGKLAPGDGALLSFAVGEITVGAMTCYDLRFPELARALVDAGATLLAVPAAWVPGPLKEDQWITLLRARAIENTCYVAAADQSPPEYAGGSAIIDPVGVPLARLGEADGVAVAEVSAARVAEVRGQMPSLEHRRYAVVPR